MTQHHIIPVRTNVVIFALLMGLLVATIGLSYVDLGRLHFATAMLIAVIKAVLIVLYFMHVRFSRPLVWVFSGAAFVWLGILLVLSLNDYLTRGWLSGPSH